MANSPWISRDRGANHRRFCAQKALVEKHFPGFKCRFSHRQWRCQGTIVPSEDCDAYDVGITYSYGGIPQVRIIQPQIVPSSAIHMYGDGTLCLYYPKNDPWKISDDLHQKVIPWTAEWLVFYELYKIQGKWLGPESPHALRPDETGSGRV